MATDPPGQGGLAQEPPAPDRGGQPPERSTLSPPSPADDPRTFRGLKVIGFADPGSQLRRVLVDMVLAGTKTATAGLLVEMELDGETAPIPGTRQVVIDADGHFVGEIETTECRVLRMADIDDAYARDEGATDAASWRAAHERYFGSYLDDLRTRLGNPDWSLTDDTLIVCHRFRLVERYPAPT